MNTANILHSNLYSLPNQMTMKVLKFLMNVHYEQWRLLSHVQWHKITRKFCNFVFLSFLWFLSPSPSFPFASKFNLPLFSSSLCLTHTHTHTHTPCHFHPYHHTVPTHNQFSGIHETYFGLSFSWVEERTSKITTKQIVYMPQCIIHNWTSVVLVTCFNFCISISVFYRLFSF